MYIIENIRTINDEFITLYIVKDKMYINLPENYSKKDFKKISFDKDTYISYGWMDAHVHCDMSNKLYNSNPDEIGYKTGVTTVIDAGSIGIDDLDRFKKQIQSFKTNIKILLNISKKGIYEQSELKNIADINLNYDKDYDNLVVGYKARMSNSVTLGSGIIALESFKNKLRDMNFYKPLMVHIGNSPPYFKDIVNLLDKGDVITHIFNFKNFEIFNDNYQNSKALNVALKKGILFDVGHGNDSFNYKCAEKSFNNGFKVDLISTDIYNTNIKNKKVVSLSSVMNKFRKIGYSWTQIIERTSSNPYKIFDINKMGEIRDGYFANLTMFKIKNENKVLIDSNENEILIEEQIIPIACIVNGIYYEVEHEKN